ncbi:unnamed protein product [Symbiodinium sp. CCMP2456]|nr:unnamed protein product [Symbiodinium sp. CCMP2456]
MAAADVRSVYEADGVSVIGDVKSPQATATLLAWHQAIKIGMGGDDTRLLEILDQILIDEPVFLAPTYHKERRDKQFIKFALLGVCKAFKRFKYTRAFLGDAGFALEFECNLGSENGPMMRGIDLVTLNSEGKVSRFEVMARPPKAVLHLLELQTAFMTEMGMVKPAKAKL